MSYVTQSIKNKTTLVESEDERSPKISSKIFKCMKKLTAHAELTKTEYHSLKKEEEEVENSTIKNLEALVKIAIRRQQELQYIINNLTEELKLQRDYHTAERSSLMREIFDLRERLNSQRILIDKTLQENEELTNAVQEANERIYVMGIKYLQLQLRSSHENVEQESYN